MARRFFYVCAGLLCLAIAYQMGARNAGAQVGGMLEGASLSQGLATIAINRVLYAYAGSIVQLTETPVPGTSPIVSTLGYNDIMAVTADGKLYSWNGSWRVLADFGAMGPTPAQKESWGSVKLRYK